MSSRSAGGEIMIEREGILARASFAFSRASFGRKIIDTMRCGSSSIRDSRSSSVISGRDSLKRQAKSRLDGVSEGNGANNTTNNVDVRAASFGSSETVQKGKLNHKSTLVQSYQNGTNSEDLDWKELVKRLRGGSEEQRTTTQQEDVRGVGTVAAEERQNVTQMDKKIKLFNQLQTTVQVLQFGKEEDKEKAAQEIRRYAKDDAEARVTLAMLGAIPPLVGMLDLAETRMHVSALFALLNLAIGNDLNKASIVKTGAVDKMVKLLQTSNDSVREAVVANFLSLSALDVNKFIVGQSGAVPFLVGIMENGSSQGRKDALRALYNLSICHANARTIVETGVAELLLDMIVDMDVSDKVLATLSNLAATEDGRKAIGNVDEAFQVLIDVLNWNDAPKCQEKAAYILMIMSHNSWSHRQAMVESGIVSSLLELTLFGTALAQKRASRILESIREDKNRRSSPVSAPLNDQQSEIDAINDRENGGYLTEERRVVKHLVQQSLQHNMQRIIKRANLPEDFAPSNRFKSLTATSSSKSLPF